MKVSQKSPLKSPSEERNNYPNFSQFWFYLLLAVLALLPFLLSEKSATPPSSASQETPVSLTISKPDPDALRGLYLTSIVATDPAPPAAKKRQEILKLLDGKNFNAAVIDVKEVAGLNLRPNLPKFLKELNDRGVYTIARFVLMADNSQTQAHPDWYLLKSDGRVWRDKRGIAWLDPANAGARNYLIESAKKVATEGFDEIQFDYLRYPADGVLHNLDYGAAALSERRFQNINEFLAKLTAALRDCQLEPCRRVRLSADVFGYITILKEDKIIGQRLSDLAAHLDYLSPMLYPSHFYKGLRLEADAARQLPALDYGYGLSDLNKDVVNRPYETVFHSLLTAKDILAAASSTAKPRPLSEVRASVVSAEIPKGRGKLRPWLQAFDLPFDYRRGISYDADKINLQIKAASAASSSGWLLWNASNVYNDVNYAQ